MSLLVRVSRFAARHDMWRRETRVVAAVSGGSDSVGLLLLLADLHTRGALTLDAVAHLHHGIRGAEADEDERHSRALARHFALPFVADRVDVPALARRQRLSLEVAARRARRAFLDQVLQGRGAHVVATGHTRDDQAETVLLRLARGTALRGLGGIAPVRVPFVRPLLDCSRAEIRRELVARDVSWREDATNADRENPRNRVRHELLPLMEQHLNPAVRRSLARLAELSRSDEAALARDAVAAGIHVIRDAAEDVVRLDGPALAALPDAVARRVVQFEVEAMTGRIPGATDVAAVLDVARGVIPRVELVRLRAEHSDDSVVLVGRGPAPAPAVPFQFNLTIPGTVQAPDGEWEIAAEGPALRGMTHPASHGLEHVQVDAELAGRALIVRNRRSGDRLRPKGLAGHKKVQDLFVDLKVPRERRDRVPIVTDGTGRIIWVAGHALAAEFGVTDRTKAVIILKLRRRQRLGR